MNNDIINKLKVLKPLLKEKYGIEEFAIFGSVARGEEKENSDVDIVILKMQIKSGWDIINAKYFIEKVLRRRVDIGTLRSMKTFIKNRIKNEMIYV